MGQELYKKLNPNEYSFRGEKYKEVSLGLIIDRLLQSGEIALIEKGKKYSVYGNNFGEKGEKDRIVSVLKYRNLSLVMEFQHCYFTHETESYSGWPSCYTERSTRRGNRDRINIYELDEDISKKPLLNRCLVRLFSKKKSNIIEGSSILVGKFLVETECESYGKTWSNSRGGFGESSYIDLWPNLIQEDYLRTIGLYDLFENTVNALK